MNRVKQCLMVTWIAVAAGTMAGAYAADPQAAANGYNKQKVVYHINELDKADGALRNVMNHINAVGDENAEVVVVTHSQGALMLVDGSTDSKGRSFDTAIQGLANRGVQFQICANTIDGLEIDKSKINLNAEVVPSGVAQVAHLQQQGYLYVKP